MNRILRSAIIPIDKYALTAIRCRPVLYSKVRSILLIGWIHRFFLETGESKYRIMAGRPILSVFAGSKKFSFCILVNSRVQGRFRLLILDRHGSHLTPQFDRICAENNIIPLCMPSHPSHILQPLDVGYSAVLKRVYSPFLSDLSRTGHNRIDKLDFVLIIHTQG